LVDFALGSVTWLVKSKAVGEELELKNVNVRLHTPTLNLTYWTASELKTVEYLV